MVATRNITVPPLKRVVKNLLLCNLVANNHIVVRHRNETFDIQPSQLKWFGDALVDCFFDGSDMVLDGDIFLNLIAYYKKVIF